jgi:hypothetical protein
VLVIHVTKKLVANNVDRIASKRLVNSRTTLLLTLIAQIQPVEVLAAKNVHFHNVLVRSVHKKIAQQLVKT